MDFNKEFSVAHDGTEEQKRKHEILAVQDKERRDALEAMLRYRDEQMKREAERQAAERKRIADEEIAKKVKPDISPRPPGIAGISIEQQKERIRNQVEAKYAPEHAEQLTAKTQDLNREIDRATAEARSQDEKILEERRQAAQSAGGDTANSQTPSENWKKAAFQKHQGGSQNQSKGRKI